MPATTGTAWMEMPGWYLATVCPVSILARVSHDAGFTAHKGCKSKVGGSHPLPIHSVLLDLRTAALGRKERNF